jgi:hypothetical protein
LYGGAISGEKSREIKKLGSSRREDDDEEIAGLDWIRGGRSDDRIL